MIIQAWIAYKRKKNERKSKTKAVEKKSIPTYYLSFNSGEKKINKKQMNNYFLPQFCPLDNIQVKTRVIDDQIFQILFQTTTSHYILKHTHNY